MDGALGQAEARFRAFVSASTDIIFRMNPDWSELREVDGRGFIADTIEARRNWMDDYILPEDQPDLQEAIAKAVGDRQMDELRAHGGAARPATPPA